MGKKLLPHQKEAIRYLWNNKGVGCIFLQPGRGKTLVAIKALRTPCLVICRRDDYLTWNKELTEIGISEKEIITVNFGEDWWNSETPTEYTICSYDLVKAPQINKLIKKTQFKSVVADEAQQIRKDSERTKEVIGATRHIPARVAMTATPVGNDLTDIFRIFYFVYGGSVLGHNYYKFRNSYCVRCGYKWVFRRGALGRLKDKVDKHSYNKRVPMNLPKASSTVLSLPLQGDQREMYNEVKNNWQLTEYDGSIHLYRWVLDRLSKLRQLATGFFYQDQQDVWCKYNKVRYLQKLLRTDEFFKSRKKIVIWAYHVAEMRRVWETLGDDSVIYGAGWDTDGPREKFFKDPSIKYFIGQADAGVGMNELVVADTAIYLSNSMRWISRVQSEGRTRRKGSEQYHKEVYYFDIITEGTINETELEAIRAGVDLQDYIVRGVQKQLRNKTGGEVKL